MTYRVLKTVYFERLRNFLASERMTSAPNALLLLPDTAAARSTMPFSASDRYTTSLWGLDVFALRRAS